MLREVDDFVDLLRNTLLQRQQHTLTAFVTYIVKAAVNRWLGIPQAVDELIRIAVDANQLDLLPCAYATVKARRLDPGSLVNDPATLEDDDVALAKDTLLAVPAWERPPAAHMLHFAPATMA